MYLVDTNVWLERLLDQNYSEQIGVLFNKIPSSELFITEFALYSIGISMTHENRLDELLLFLKEVILESNVRIIRLNISDYELITDTVKKQGLDFDDAYQYVSAEKNGLIIVSLDKGFDHTDRGRKTPTEVLRK